ncbi:hypothetical protein LXL04_009439 [Taraxacum kok-saghyz]
MVPRFPATMSSPLSFSSNIIPDMFLTTSNFSRLSIAKPPPSTTIRMGGGPRTFPGGVSKWQWKRMQAKKAKQLLRARLARERQVYEMRKRAELTAAISELERPWEVVEKAPKLFSTTADEQVKVLADRFQKPGGFDLWCEKDGPQVFENVDGIPSSRFFPKGVVHSIKPYGRITEEADDMVHGGERKFEEKNSDDVRSRNANGKSMKKGMRKDTKRQWSLRLRAEWKYLGENKVSTTPTLQRGCLRTTSAKLYRRRGGPNVCTLMEESWRHRRQLTGAGQREAASGGAEQEEGDDYEQEEAEMVDTKQRQRCRVRSGDGCAMNSGADFRNRASQSRELEREMEPATRKIMGTLKF